MTVAKFGSMSAPTHTPKASRSSIETSATVRSVERLVQDSEAFTRLLLDSTSEAFYSVDREGVTTLCNAAFVNMLGFESREAVVGRRLHDVIHHSHPDGSKYPSRDCPIYQAASQGRPAFVSDELFFRLDGTSFPVEYRAEPMISDGELQGAICTFNDITSRKPPNAPSPSRLERSRP